MLNNKDIEKLTQIFATKEDIKDFATKDEIVEFKNEILTGQDEILEKLDILLTEKPIKEEQDKRQKKVLEIHNKVLKKNKILSKEEILEVDKLGAF